MRVTYNERTFEFRACDTKGITQEELQRMTDANGEMVYEPNRSWLLVRGVGYGWEVKGE